MAFISSSLTTSTVPVRYTSTKVIKCSAEQKQPQQHTSKWQSRTISAAAGLLVSVALLTTNHSVLADDYPLIFDHDQTLSGADFSNRTDLKGSIFSKANCKGASFTGADLTNAQIDDANMMGANLEGVTAVNVSATKTKFQKANLKNADFTNANLVSAVFDGADIEGADFTDSLLDRTSNFKLCKIAKGVNPKTGVSTAESLMCPE